MGAAPTCQVDPFTEILRRSGRRRSAIRYDVRAVNGVTITIERELRGVPLQKYLSENADAPLPDAVSCVIDILRGLQSVRSTQCMWELAVLDEPCSFWAGTRSWSDALVALMFRRVEKFGDQLRSHVDDFDIKYARIVEKVNALNRDYLSPIHGDMCPANILVDGDCKISAVLDFGFLSTAGDPAFDTSISAAIFDMYGLDARSIADTLTARLAREFEYPIELLRLYQAAYAIISSNVYDPEGRDGHFAWSAAILNEE